jgi:hypothetical protein
MIAAPSGATHFKIETAGAEIDFENETYVIDAKESAVLAIRTTRATIGNHAFECCDCQ